MSKQLFWLALIIFAEAAIGVLSWDFGFGYSHDTILGLTGFAIGITTLFGIMRVSDSSGREWSLTKGALRSAIAASIIVTYFFLVAFNTFLVTPKEESAVTKAFVDSFTGIVGVTIAFYFGASAVLQALGKEETPEADSTVKIKGV